MKIKKAVIFLIIAHIVGIFFLKRLFMNKETPLKKTAIEAVTVRAVSLTREDLDLVFSYVGNIKAKNEAKIYSKVHGKLDSYLLSEGDRVKKDETVALVERDETGLKYELAKVNSPIDGVVGKVFLDKGENILAQSTPVALVIDSGEAVVRIDIPEQDIPYISKGCPARLKLDSYPEEIFIGVVSKVSQVLDPDARALDVEITMANPENKLKSGMFARIDILA
ncbi:MAG: efflux RND transporter periplasmic adaptor subunit, partial [Patescibacteria group bacterium]